MPIHGLSLMTVRTRQHRPRTPVLRARLARAAQRPNGKPAADPESPPPPQTRERSAGGPEDRALYRCQCGYVFEASVSANVGCPHCGDTQAW
jgi:rubrerythrin